MADGAILAGNFLLGVFAFFAPCGFPMLPAYVAYYLPGTNDKPRGVVANLARGLGGGLLAATGAFLVLLLIGGLALAIGAPFKQRVVWLELIGGIVVIVLGIRMMMGKSLSLKVGLRPSQRKGALSLLGFGALYAGTASSCVAPILIGVLVPALAAPNPLDGLVQVGAYAAGMGVLLLGASVAIALSQDRLVAAMRRVVPHVERLAGGLLIAAGIYLIWFWAAVEFGIPAPPALPTP